MSFRIVYNGSDKPLRPGLEQEALIESKSIIRGKNTFITSIHIHSRIRYISYHVIDISRKSVE